MYRPDTDLLPGAMVQGGAAGPRLVHVHALEPESARTAEVRRGLTITRALRQAGWF